VLKISLYKNLQILLLKNFIVKKSQKMLLRNLKKNGRLKFHCKKIVTQKSVKKFRNRFNHKHYKQI